MITNKTTPRSRSLRTALALAATLALIALLFAGGIAPGYAEAATDAASATAPAPDAAADIGGQSAPATIAPPTAHAAPDRPSASTSPSPDDGARIVDAGIWGTCPWELDATGTMTVYPGTAGEPVAKVTAFGGGVASGVYAELVVDTPWQSHPDVVRILFKGRPGEAVVLPAYARKLFANLPNLVSIDFSGADLSRMKDLSGLFSGCTNLTRVNFGNHAGIAPTSLAQLFKGCRSLVSARVTGLDTSNVKDFSEAFAGCARLKSIDVARWDTSQATSLRRMFSGCSSLQKLDVARWSTGRVTDMDKMFKGCTKLRKVRVGSTFRFVGAGGRLPSAKVNGKTTWRSAKTHQRFTSHQIATKRSGKADTYTKA